MIVDENIIRKLMDNKAVMDVVQERLRQVNEEGYSHEHDDKCEKEELIKGASAYIFSSPYHWPGNWSYNKFKPTTNRRNLVKAAALIIAEIERLDRSEEIKCPREEK